MATKELTAKNFEEILTSNDIVVLDFWAEWCGPCKMFGPVFEEMSNKNEDIVFGKVNTETERELAATFQIRSIPMLIIFKEQIPVFSQPGMLPPPALESLISQVRGLNMDEVRTQIAAAEAEKDEK